MVLRQSTTMTYLLPFVCLMCISRNILGEYWNNGGHYEEEISYQDLIDIRGSCYPLDSCVEPRPENPVNPSPYSYMCSCNSQCWEIGTCCIDSPYRVYTPNHKCQSTGDSLVSSGYYMIHICPDNVNADSVWKNQCEKEWSDEDDILMISPITSLVTSQTYKNYYCFRCHETTDDFVPWNLFLESSYNVSEEIRDSRLTYNRGRKTWMANLDENQIYIPVNVSFQYPHTVEQLPMTCDLSIISDCADNWTDARIRDKCLSYTAVIHEGITSYKNAHCALCNYKSFDSFTCKKVAVVAVGFGGSFNFKHLLNINSDDFDKAGSTGKCEKDQMWDPYAKKCRKKSCALPRYVVKNDRCVPP